MCRMSVNSFKSESSNPIIAKVSAKTNRPSNIVLWIIAAFIAGIIVGILLTVFYLGKLAI